MRYLFILSWLLFSCTPAYSDNGSNKFFQDLLKNVCKNDPNYCTKASRPYLEISHSPKKTHYDYDMIIYLTNNHNKRFPLPVRAYSPDLKDAVDEAWEREKIYFTPRYQKAFKKIRNASITQNCLGFVLQQLFYDTSPRYRNLKSEFSTIGVNNFYSGFISKYWKSVVDPNRLQKNDIVFYIQKSPGGNAIHVGLIKNASSESTATILSKDRDGYVFEVNQAQVMSIGEPVLYFNDSRYRKKYYRIDPNKITIEFHKK